MAADQQRHYLSYGRAPAFRWGRLSRRVAAAVAVVTLLALLGGWLFLRLPEMLAQRRAMRYLAPPDQVIFDNDPAAAARLIGTGHYTEVSANYKDRTGLNGAARQIDLGGSLEYVDGVVFVHGRRVPGHSDFRLVVVCGVSCIHRTGSGCGVGLDASCHQPPPISLMSSTSGTSRSGWLAVPPGQRLRIFAGQPDPTDDSHFTIVYELGGVPGLIEGWLRDESFHGVELKVTQGPIVLDLVQ